MVCMSSPSNNRMKRRTIENMWIGYHNQKDTSTSLHVLLRTHAITYGSMVPTAQYDRGSKGRTWCSMRPPISCASAMPMVRLR
jgi:hypothetical protein